jgi:hypothetical protein
MNVAELIQILQTVDQSLEVRIAVDHWENGVTEDNIYPFTRLDGTTILYISDDATQD